MRVCSRRYKMQELRKKVYRFRMKYSDRIFDACNLIIMCLLLVIFVWPLWFVLIASFSDPNAVYSGKVLLFPKGFNLNAYINTMKYELLWSGYANTIFYTVAGTLINLFMTVCAAYPLSRKEFPPRRVLLYFLLFTMYFGGGLIPTYLVVKNLHMVNTRWAMLIPGACSVYNVLITRSYFKNSIPESLFEAARIDGANSYQQLVRIVLPLSKPILAVIGLYYGVGHWNAYYNALIYLQDVELLPLQSALRDILLASKIMSDGLGGVITDRGMAERMQLIQSMRYSSIIIGTIPVLVVYPFVQKFFVKGVMIGSIKE